jgi:putative transposase
VRLVTSDAHRGLKGAIEAVLQGASWQRCRVHFMRNALSLVPKAAQQMVGATIRTVFAQPDANSAQEQWRRVSDGFRHRFSRLSELMDERPSTTSWPTLPSPKSTGRRSGPTTRWRE